MSTLNVACLLERGMESPHQKLFLELVHAPSPIAVNVAVLRRAIDALWQWPRGESLHSPMRENPCSI